MLTCLKNYTRADVYLSLMRVGPGRVDIDGTSVATFTMQEDAYARAGWRKYTNILFNREKIMTSEQFERRKQKAIALMDSRKMWRSNYAPPLLRGLWKLGLKIPPAPFMSFWHVLVLVSVWYSVVWGLVMYFCTWRAQGMPPLVACVHSLCAGLFFGFFMALFHLWRKKVNGFPDWSELD